MSEEIKDGYVRVSEILKSYTDFSSIPEEILRKKCAIGSDVHAWIEAHRNHEFYVPMPEAKPYIQSYLSCYAKDLQYFDPFFMEKRYYCDRLKLTGKIDMLACKEDKMYLVDYKTSAKANFPLWSLQLNLYAYLIGESVELETPLNGLVIQLSKTSFRLWEIPITPQMLDLSLAAVNLHWFMKRGCLGKTAPGDMYACDTMSTKECN